MEFVIDHKKALIIYLTSVSDKYVITKSVDEKDGLKLLSIIELLLNEDVSEPVLKRLYQVISL